MLTRGPRTECGNSRCRRSLVYRVSGNPGEAPGEQWRCRETDLPRNIRRWVSPLALAPGLSYSKPELCENRADPWS